MDKAVIIFVMRVTFVSWRHIFERCKLLLRWARFRSKIFVWWWSIDQIFKFSSGKFISALASCVVPTKTLRAYRESVKYLCVFEKIENWLVIVIRNRNRSMVSREFALCSLNNSVRRFTNSNSNIQHGNCQHGTMGIWESTSRTDMYIACIMYRY